MGDSAMLRICSSLARNRRSITLLRPTEFRWKRWKHSESSKSVAERFSWLLTESNKSGVVDGLKDVYKNKLLPLEKMYSFHNFHSPSLSDVDFEVLPQVLVVGQYSTGKSSLIKHLLRSDFPGIR